METKKYAEIINKGECLPTLNAPPADSIIDWSKYLNIKHLAGKNEWAKHDFYPANGLVGEIVGIICNPLGFNMYILFIENKYYVPMSEKGIKFLIK